MHVPWRITVGSGFLLGMDDADREDLRKALGSFSDDDLTITVEDATNARMALIEREREFAEGLSTLSKAMHEEGLRRGLNKEERSELTIGDLAPLSEETEEER